MYVYETTNLINGKKYIGVCLTKNKKKSEVYLGSGLLLLKSIKKYGRHNFKKEIIKEFSNEKDARDYERYLISKMNAISSNDYYNLTPGGYGGFTICRKISEDTKRKISKANKGKKMPSHQIESMSNITLKYDLDGHFLQEYSSKSDAERINHINLTGIEKGIIFHSGFLWKYKDEFGYDDIESYCKMVERYNMNNSKRNSKWRCLLFLCTNIPAFCLLRSGASILHSRRPGL